MKQSKVYKLTGCTCVLFIILFLFTINLAQAVPQLVQTKECKYAETRLLDHVPSVLLKWELYDNGIANFSISGVPTSLNEKSNYIVKYRKGIMRLTKVENINGTIRKLRSSKEVTPITGSWTFEYALTSSTGEIWYATLWDSSTHRITVALKCVTTTGGPVVTIHTEISNNPSTTTEQKKD